VAFTTPTLRELKTLSPFRSRGNHGLPTDDSRSDLKLTPTVFHFKNDSCSQKSGGGGGLAKTTLSNSGFVHVFNP
jgi:hypothetical protein